MGMGIPRVHHPDTLLAALGTAIPAAQLATCVCFLSAAAGLHCVSVLIFRRPCNFSSTTAGRQLLVTHPYLDHRAAKDSDQTNPVRPQTR